MQNVKRKDSFADERNNFKTFNPDVSCVVRDQAPRH